MSIQPFGEPRKVCERQAQIVAGNLSGDQPTGPGYLAWLTSVGFTQAQFSNSAFAVDVSDSGIDDGTTSPNHFGLYTLGKTKQASRVIYNRLVGTPNAGSTLMGCDGHGTIDAHIKTLRKKLGRSSKKIETVPAIGYRWAESDAA